MDTKNVDMNTSTIMYDPILDSQPNPDLKLPYVVVVSDSESSGILVNKETSYDNNKCNDDDYYHMKMPDSSLLINSTYFIDQMETDKKKQTSFDMYKLLCELLIFGLLMYIFSLNIITIDAIITSTEFYIMYMGYDTKIKKYVNTNANINSYTINSLKRYTYYTILYICMHAIDFIFWFKLSVLIHSCMFILSCPSILNYIHDSKHYTNFITPFYNVVNKTKQTFICKQLTKIINNIIKNTLKLDIRINWTDLLPYYNTVTVNMINQFLVSFILAHIFNYADKGGMRLPMSIYKNIYMKDDYAKIRDDKKYIETIITKKEWSKLVDIYSLNRLIRLSLSDESDYMSKQVDFIMRKLLFIFERIMFTWTVLTISNIYVALSSLLLFVSKEKNPVRYVLNIIIFLIISFFTNEEIILLILFEVTTIVINRSFYDDGINFIKINRYKFLDYVYELVRKTIITDTFVTSLIISLLQINNNFESILTVIIYVEILLTALFLIFRSEYVLKILILLIFGSLSHYNLIYMIMLPFAIQILIKYL